MFLLQLLPFSMVFNIMVWCFSGMRVLIVDQWIETGGTMKAAIKLVEKQGASVVGEHSFILNE